MKSLAAPQIAATLSTTARTWPAGRLFRGTIRLRCTITVVTAAAADANARYAKTASRMSKPTSIITTSSDGTTM